MSFPYTSELIDSALPYSTYRQHLDEALSKPAPDEAAAKMQPYTKKNVSIMKRYDATVISETLKSALEAAPPAIWLVLTEGWCGDAAFNVPVLAALEKAVPHKLRLGILLRDSNPDLIDAHLTDGGRSIPKVIMLNERLEELSTWGPRPEGLQHKMKQWKSEGLELKELIPKVQEWYDADGTKSVQEELEALIQAYS